MSDTVTPSPMAMPQHQIDHSAPSAPKAKAAKPRTRKPRPTRQPKADVAQDLEIKLPEFGMAEKHVVITSDGWVDHLPFNKRADTMKNIFSLATQAGWDIEVEHQHWGLAA